MIKFSHIEQVNTFSFTGATHLISLYKQEQINEIEEKASSMLRRPLCINGKASLMKLDNRDVENKREYYIWTYPDRYGNLKFGRKALIVEPWDQ